MDEYCVEKEIGEQTADKREVKAWKDAYERLEKIYSHMHEIVESKKRAREFGIK